MVVSTGAMAEPVDPSTIFDPRTYHHGVPYREMATLRAARTGVPRPRARRPRLVRGPRVLGGDGPPEVNRVLRDPATFSSHLGGTQIRDPATPPAGVRPAHDAQPGPARAHPAAVVAGPGVHAVPPSRRLESTRSASGPVILVDRSRRGARPTSPSTWPPTCPCSRWPTSSACRPATAGCSTTGPTASSATRTRTTPSSDRFAATPTPTVHARWPAAAVPPPGGARHPPTRRAALRPPVPGGLADMFAYAHALADWKRQPSRATT